MRPDTGLKMKRTGKAGRTIQEVLLGVVKHVRIFEAGELALQPAQIAFPSACCCVFGLLTENLLLLDCDILNALQRPAVEGFGAFELLRSIYSCQ